MHACTHTHTGTPRLHKTELTVQQIHCQVSQINTHRTYCYASGHLGKIRQWHTGQIFNTQCLHARYQQSSNSAQGHTIVVCELLGVGPREEGFWAFSYSSTSAANKQRTQLPYSAFNFCFLQHIIQYSTFNFCFLKHIQYSIFNFCFLQHLHHL